MLSEDEFRALARLARLDPDDESLSGLRDDFNKILDYVEKIKELDTGAVEEYYTAIDTRNVVREDEREETLPLPEIEKMSPEWDSGHFVVPRVIAQPNGSSHSRLSTSPSMTRSISGLYRS